MFTVFQAFMPHQMRNKHSHKTKVDIFCKTGTHDRSGYFFTARKGKNIFDAPIKIICMRTRIKQITLCHNGSRYWGAFPWLFLLWWCAKNDELTDLYAYLQSSPIDYRAVKKVAWSCKMKPVPSWILHWDKTDVARLKCITWVKSVKTRVTLRKRGTIVREPNSDPSHRCTCVTEQLYFAGLRISWNFEMQFSSFMVISCSNQ